MEGRSSENSFLAIAGTRILVTGGAGLVGSSIVDALLRENPAEIRVLDYTPNGEPTNLSKAPISGGVNFIRTDIRDRDAVNRACVGVDYIFHQAAIRVTHCQEEPRFALEVMVDGTFNILEAAVAHGVRKIIAASSAIVYGSPIHLPVAETHPLLDRTMYGIAKISNEQMLEAFSKKFGLRYVALRYFNIYGPRMNLFGPYTEVLIRWLDRIDEGLAPVILGDGSQTMDFVYIDDVVAANLLALRRKVSNEAINVGTGVETSLNQLAKSLLAVLKSNLKIEYQEARAVNQIPRRFADMSKANRLLGFKAKTRLEDGLRELIQWRAIHKQTLKSLN